MRDDMDTKALFSSEVFKNYVAIELEKEAKAARAAIVDEKKVIEDFQSFEKRVNASVQLKQTFAALKKEFENNSALREKTDSRFVDAVMLLSIEE